MKINNNNTTYDTKKCKQNFNLITYEFMNMK